MTQTETTTKRWPAALAHAAILIPGIGFVLPLMLWQREENPQNKGQILQAFVYQMMQVIFWQVVLLVELILLVLFQIVNAQLAANYEAMNGFLIAALLVLAAVFIFANLLYITIGLLAAIQVSRGKDWQYPWLGKKVNASLFADGSLDEDFGIRLVAAIDHFGIFFGLSCILVPFITWIIAKERAVTLHYHAMQALVIQALAQVFLHLMMVLIGIAASPLMIALVTIPSHDTESFLTREMLLVSMVILGILMCLTVLLHPLLAVLATIAGIRLLKNKEYDYPMIGKMIKKRIMGVPASSGLHRF